MAEKTKIEWCDHTFNCWRGCTKVSPGCAHCYAEQLSVRNPKVLGEWGHGGVRAIAAESYWQLPIRWNRQAQKAGVRRKVFCLSLGDVFEDRPDLDRPLARLLRTIDLTPNLDWLLLTKRPELFERRMLAAASCRAENDDEADGAELANQWRLGAVVPNIWMGVSIEDQLRCSRIYDLQSIPAPVRFLSCEPLLGPLDFADGPLDAAHSTMGEWSLLDWIDWIDWVIVGGESGGDARECDLAWIRGIVAQCRKSDVPVFVKQLGRYPVSKTAGRVGPTLLESRTGVLRMALDMAVEEELCLRDRKGGDMAEWPADLRVREFPTLKGVSR